MEERALLSRAPLAESILWNASNELLLEERTVFSCTPQANEVDVAPIDLSNLARSEENGSENFVVSNAQGNEWLVTTTQDDATVVGSLRYALGSASNGDVVCFDPELNGQTITLTGSALLVGKSLTIDASSLADGITINADGKSRVFTVHSSVGTSTVELKGLTITGGLTTGTGDGDGGAGVYNQGEKLTLTNCVVTGNTTSSLGGGIYNTGTITISGGSITNNEVKPERANTWGGGMYSIGYATLDNVVISSNHVEGINDAQGGGVYARGSFVADGCEFTGNTTLGKYSVWGGGVFIYEESEATICNSSFTSNGARHTEESWNVRGGAICTRGVTTIDGCSFISNTLDGTYAYGGAIDNLDGTLTVKKSLFEENMSGNSTISSAGGAIFSRYGSLTLEESAFNNNWSQGDGGAIYVERAGSESELFFKSINCNYEGNQSITTAAGAILINSMTTTIQGGEFKNNSASSLGGAIRQVGGSVTLDGVSFTSNTSGNEGGAIQTHECEIEITNSTFLENEAHCGGALRLYKTPFSILNSAFSKNVSVYEGGAMKNDECASAVMTSCVFSENSASTVGGAIQMWNTTLYSFNDLHFTNNVSSDRGGAIHLSGGENVSALLTNIKAKDNSSGAPGGAFYFNIPASGKVVLQDSEFDGNETSSFGGAIYTEGGQTEITRVVATNNVAINNDGGALTLNGTNTIVDSVFTGNSGYHGGAIRNDGDLEISSSVFSENAAKDNGGAIYHCNSGKLLKIVDTSIVNNTCLTLSNGSGGAIEAYGKLEVVNSLLAGNEILQRGGAVWFNNEFTIVNSTVAYNKGGEGGGIWQDGGTFTAINTLIASNLANSYPDARVTQATSLRNNVVGKGDNFAGLTNGENGNLLGTSDTPLDACMGPITQDDAGRYFVPIASFSPAVDAGLDSDAVPAVDALGQTRYDAPKSNSGSGTKKYVDVGAYEYQSTKHEGQVDYKASRGGNYHSLAVDSHDNVYATDQDYGVVRVFDATGQERRIIGEWGEGAGQLVSPRGIAVGENDALYVLSSSGVVQVYDSSGDYQRTLFANGGLSEPHDLCFDLATKRLYIVDAGNNGVLCFSPTGVLQWKVGGLGAKSDHTGFDNPTSIAVHPKTGELWIADYNNDRIEIYNAQGQYVATKDAISKATSLAFDSEGNLFYGSNANVMSGKLYYEGRLGVLREGQTYAGPYFFGGLDDLGRITQGVVVRTNGDVLYIDALNRRIVQTTPGFNKTTGPSSFDDFSVPIDNLDIDANGTNAVFTWTTREAFPTYVRMGTSADSMEIVAQNTTKTKNHTITVYDLTPQTVLYYQVGYPDTFNGEIRWTEAERINTGVEVGQKQILRLKAITIIYTDKNFSSEGYERAPQSEIDAALDSFHKTCQYIYQATRFNVWIDESAVLYYDGDLAGDDFPNSEALAREKGYTVADDFDIVSCFRLGGGGGVGGSGGFLDRWIGGQWTTWGDGFNVHELDHAFDFAIYGDFAKYRDCHSTWQIIDSEGVEDGVHNAAIYGGLLDASYAAHFSSFTKFIVVPDADDDGVPDDSPIDQGLVRPLPITEKTLGSSPNKKDSDGDGLSDLQEATLFIYGGSDPTNPDCNGDGIRDGDDLNPVYVMNPEVQQGTPTIDGKINEDEWTQVTDHYAYPSEYYLRSNGNADVFSLYSSWDDDYLYLGFKTDGAHWINLRVDGGCDNIMVGQDNITMSFYSGSSNLDSVTGGLYNFDVNDICEKLAGGGAWLSSGMYLMDLQNAIYTKDDIVFARSYNRAFDVYDWEIAIPWKNEVTGFNPYNKKVMGLALYVDGNYVFNAGGYGKLRLNKTFDLGFSLSSASVSENKPAGTVVGAFSPFDPSLEVDTVYSLVESSEGVNQECFTIVGNQLKLSKSLDYESQPLSRLLVRADFGENGMEEKWFEIVTLDVAEPIEISLTGYSGTYDKHTHGTAISGVESGDVVRYSVDGVNWSATSPQFIDAGTYTVSATVNRAGFDPWSGSTTVNIDQRSVKVSITAVDVKEYDGNNTATGAYKLDGVLSGDTVTLSGGAFEFSNANSGVNKTVTFKNYRLVDFPNYKLSNSSATWAQGAITPRKISVEWRVQDEYVYTSAAQDSSVVAGFVNVQNRWQNVSVAFSGNGTTFLNAGDYKATASYESDNYVLTNNLEKTLTMKPAPLTMTFVPKSKTYDGSTRATYDSSFSGVLGSDVVSLKSANCVFIDKNVGVNKTVTISNCVLNNANYVLAETSQTVATGVITARTLLYSGGKVRDKTWDGDASATFVDGALANALDGDDLQLITSCEFPDSVPNHYNVEVSFTLSGADAGNYKPIPSKTYSAKIKPGIALGAEVYEISAANDVFAQAQALGCEDATFTWSIGEKTLDATSSEVWLQVGTGNLPVGSYALTATAEYNGVESEPAVAILRVAPTSPTLRVETNEFLDGRALRIAVDRFDFGERVAYRQVVDWGDGTQTEANDFSSSSIFAHYYQNWDETTEYVVSLSLYKPGESEPETFQIASRSRLSPVEYSSAVFDDGSNVELVTTDSVADVAYKTPLSSNWREAAGLIERAPSYLQKDRFCVESVGANSDAKAALPLAFRLLGAGEKTRPASGEGTIDVAIAELFDDELIIELDF